MILYHLNCRKGHGFEAWFPSSDSYEEQRGEGKVRCPVCGSRKVEKAIMAPKVTGGRGRGRQEPAPQSEAREPAPNKAVMMRQALTDLRRQVEENCDYVGPRFAEEARKIHYGETEERNIYGESSDEEASDLADEGIAFKRIPWLPKTDA